MVARSSATTQSTRCFSISREQRTKNKEHVSIASLFSVLCSWFLVLPPMLNERFMPFAIERFGCFALLVILLLSSGCQAAPAQPPAPAAPVAAPQPSAAPATAPPATATA